MREGRFFAEVVGQEAEEAVDIALVGFRGVRRCTTLMLQVGEVFFLQK
jgi:hypothetical protein